MDYRHSAALGKPISWLTLGCWMFGTVTSVAEATRIIHQAREHGINSFDTADNYGYGASEMVLGEALRKCREQCLVTTKVYGQASPDPHDRGLAPSRLRRACERSLRRLRTGYIDLYLLHRPDRTVPIADTVGALAELAREGKIRAFGTSTFTADQIDQAQHAARASGVVLCAEQLPYNLLERTADRGVFATCARWGMHVFVWSPLAGGLLSGKYGPPGTPLPDGSRFARWPKPPPGLERARAAVEAIASVAQQAQLSVAQLALRWLRGRPGIDSVVIGPRTEQQLEQYLESSDGRLDAVLEHQIGHLVPAGSTLLSSYHEEF